MNDNDTFVNDSDILICQAFKQILTNPPVKLEEKLSNQVRFTIATYLAQLPLEEKLDPAKMANHITEFCQQPGNEYIEESLGDVYDSLDQDGIDNLVKKTGDPGDNVDDSTEIKRMLANEGRDICQFLQGWANEELQQRNQINQNVAKVVNQKNQGNQNVPNSN
ncbi:hypothetical protein [Nostoc sp. 'Peltigera membranacea cyanobiont' N6]|uniref:hypothetical protein n=1 Tax=Nostoc sp. 'Peltigera membranacea cyanobiont' N6 TaxID=1261031 RepID=UPI000CF33857|nr:hypothetical protein [Nostoc sp. 'Peltigera membranacea cyanobiont' N6]AVH66190.1 hypothetical protein NPM_4676 [Nostoc sp. 'Peltigera membranacea cyanobiont' N6]